MMKIGATNYKCLRRKTLFDLLPLTILVGPNGAGKSTYLELLELVQRVIVKEGPRAVFSAKEFTNSNGNTSIRNRQSEVDEYIEVHFEYSTSRGDVSLTYKFRESEGFRPYTYYLEEIQMHYEVEGEQYEVIKSSHPDSSGNSVNLHLNIEVICRYFNIEIDEKQKREVSEGVYLRIRREKSWIELVNGELSAFANQNLANAVNTIARHISGKSLCNFGLAERLNLDNVIDDSIFKSSDHPDLEVESGLNEWDRVYWIKKALRHIGFCDEALISEETDGMYKLTLLKSDKELPVSSLSKGEKRMLKLVLGLSGIIAPCLGFAYGYRSLTLIEEPENSLHPKWQSFIADLLAIMPEHMDIIGEDGNELYTEEEILTSMLIIETHSEYIIRKLQILCAKGEIRSSDINIVYFPKDPNLENDPYQIIIQEDGRLSREFGSGFVDEADNLAIELFTMSMN